MNNAKDKKPKGSDVGASKPRARQKSESGNKENGLKKKIADKVGKVKRTKKSKASKGKKSQNDVILAVLGNPAVEQSDKDIITDLLHHEPDPAWSGQSYTPPGSLPDLIVRRFEQHSDIALDLPFFITLLFISGILVKEGITISVDGNKTEISIWINLLCDTGAGKSYTLSKIRDSLQSGINDSGKTWTAKDLIWDGGAKSVAQYMREWAGFEKDGEVIEESRNRSILIIDEATDFFSEMKNFKGHLYGMYSNFLLAHSHQALSHKTVGGGKLIVEHPVISFLGMATPGRFVDQITEADIEGGFYYRWANKRGDEPRSMVGHAVYPDSILENIDVEWTKLVASIRHQEYRISDEAFEYFKRSFDEMVSEDSSMPRAYIRRMSWLRHKFALIYHLILGKGKEQAVGIEPYRWTERLMQTFMDTAAEIIQAKMHPEARQFLKKVESLIARRAERGQPTTPRDIVMNTKIPTREAELYLKIALKKPIAGQAQVKVPGGRPA